MSDFDPDVLDAMRNRFGGFFGKRDNVPARFKRAMQVKRSYVGSPEDIEQRMQSKGISREQAMREAGVYQDGEPVTADRFGPFSLERDSLNNWLVVVTAGGVVPPVLSGKWTQRAKLVKIITDYLAEHEREAVKQKPVEQGESAAQTTPAVQGRPRETDRMVALATLDRLGGDVALTAQILGINERTVRRFVEEAERNKELTNK